MAHQDAFRMDGPLLQLAGQEGGGGAGNGDVLAHAGLDLGDELLLALQVLRAGLLNEDGPLQGLLDAGGDLIALLGLGGLPGGDDLIFLQRAQHLLHPGVGQLHLTPGLEDRLIAAEDEIHRQPCADHARSDECDFSF